MFEFLEEEEEVQFADDPVSTEGLQGNVEFDHVKFGYNPDHIIIKDFSTKVKEGQKIAIARAFAQNSDILILDEPSSALDPIAEYELNKTIEAAAKDRTVIFISHRLSTTRMADRIYLFDGGKITEQGSHEELMKQDGTYAKMFRVQAKKYQG